ncbi:MAG: tRNA lysidine(34) synthetase TilS [bacterium]|nr:tRNA lysidine(34) synthetase TilS [bacterium]
MITKSKTKKASLMRRSKKSSPSSKSTLLPREAPLSPLVRRFIKRVQNTVGKFDLWHRGDAFIIGVSGGPDSLCLLDVLATLQKKYAFTLHVAHVNYHLRGRASDCDETLVGKMAAQYNLPLAVLSQKKRLKTASEETLRDIRYAFFETLRNKYGAHHIAVAHNEDDQAETFLLRLLRGSGLCGLSAMRPKNNFVIRPLIEMSRTDILEYLKERGIPYGTDTSNADERFMRNRIRHTLLPLLEKKFQPQIKKLLAHTARLLAEDFSLLEKIPALLTKKDALLNRTQLLALPETALRQLFRGLLQKVSAGKNPPRGTIDEIVKALKSTKSKTQTVACKGLRFVMKGDTVSLLCK